MKTILKSTLRTAASAGVVAMLLNLPTTAVAQSNESDTAESSAQDDTGNTDMSVVR